MSNLIPALKAKQITALNLEKIREKIHKKTQIKAELILTNISNIISSNVKSGNYKVYCSLNIGNMSVIDEVLSKLRNLGYKCEYKARLSEDSYIIISWE